MGDGLMMATEIGAATEGLGVLLLHPHIYWVSENRCDCSGAGYDLD